MPNLQNKLNQATLSISLALAEPRLCLTAGLRQQQKPLLWRIAILVGVFSVITGSGSSANTNIIKSDRNVSLFKPQPQAESETNSTRQVNDRNQLEARQNIGSINRSQSVFRSENSVFAQSFRQLGIDLPQESTHYRYSIRSSNPSKFVQSFGTAKTKGLKNYLGLVVTYRNKIGQDIMTMKVCVSSQPNSRVIPNSSAPKMKDGDLLCPQGYESAIDN
jgi:Type IV pilin-like G and H, putative